MLLALGVWQMQRLSWKEGVLADIEARIVSAPVPLPAEPDPVADRYRPVRMEGSTTGEELHLLVSTRETGAAWRVVAGFTTDDGRRVLLDRGLLRYTDKDVRRPPERITVIGNLHWPDEVDGFTPEPEPDANIWFARDVPAMAAALGTEPVLVVARTTGSDATVPLPVTADGIPNDHLGYAVTWFGLAAVWAAMTVLWTTRRARS